MARAKKTVPCRQTRQRRTAASQHHAHNDQSQASESTRMNRKNYFVSTCSSGSRKGETSVRWLALQHQEQWLGLNGGRPSPLFNLDAFAATCALDTRRCVRWRCGGGMAFELRHGATVPVLAATSESDHARCSSSARSSMHSCTDDGDVTVCNAALQAEPGLYFSQTPNRQAFLSARDRLLDGVGSVDASVQSSILLSLFTSTDCDCAIAALAIAQSMYAGPHPPFILQDIRPLNKHLCRGVFDGRIGKRGGYRVPSGASVLRNGHLRTQRKLVAVEDVKEHIREEAWERDLAVEEDSLQAITARVQQWRAQLGLLGLADSCRLGRGSWQHCSAITAGFYHMDWLFTDPQSGLPRPAKAVQELSARYSESSRFEQERIFQYATRVHCSAKSRNTPSDLETLTSFLEYIRLQENAEVSITLFTGCGLTSIVWLARHMTVRERRRVHRMGHMILTTDPTQSILQTAEGHGVSYNEAVDLDACHRAFFSHAGKSDGARGSGGRLTVQGDDIAIRKWFPNAAVFIWNTMSSKGVLEQSL